ncbi:MAG: acyl carrier protein [Planctomycetota bacterium]
MDREEIVERVIEVVSDVLGVPEGEIAEDDEFVGDLGAESIQSLELVASFEEEFDIEMEESEALEVQTVGDAVDFIADYL